MILVQAASTMYPEYLMTSKVKTTYGIKNKHDDPTKQSIRMNCQSLVAAHKLVSLTKNNEIFYLNPVTIWLKVTV